MITGRTKKPCREKNWVESRGQSWSLCFFKRADPNVWLHSGAPTRRCIILKLVFLKLFSIGSKFCATEWSPRTALKISLWKTSIQKLFFFLISIVQLNKSKPVLWLDNGNKATVAWKQKSWRGKLVLFVSGYPELNIFIDHNYYDLNKKLQARRQISAALEINVSHFHILLPKTRDKTATLFYVSTKFSNKTTQLPSDVASQQHGMVTWSGSLHTTSITTTKNSY